MGRAPTRISPRARPRLRRGHYCKPAGSCGRLRRTLGSARGAQHAARTRPHRSGMPERRPQEQHVPFLCRKPFGGRVSCRWLRTPQYSRDRGGCSGPASVGHLRPCRHQRRRCRTGRSRSKPLYTPPGGLVHSSLVWVGLDHLLGVGHGTPLSTNLVGYIPIVPSYNRSIPRFW